MATQNVYRKDAFLTSSKATDPANLLPKNQSDGNTKHYLLFGEGHISVTNSCSTNEWKNIDHNATFLSRNISWIQNLLNISVNFWW